MRYVSSKEARMYFHISAQTLKRWKDSDKISTKQYSSRKILYDLDSINKNDETNSRRHVIYARVSCSNQKQSLDNQIELIKSYMISKGIKVDEIYSEIASGLNENRKELSRLIMDIDIGWSVVDWKDEYKYKVISHGTYSIKELNDTYFKLKGASSDDPRKIKLTNKRHFEIYEIAKKLVQTACKYSCSLFGIEDLSIESEDYGRGKNYNRLVNSFWCRNLIVNSLTKHCNINGIRLLEVRPEYSSFIGNIAYRKFGLPDMELSSIEIGRRAYEFYNQHIVKTKEIKKNIVQPETEGFGEAVSESLEEFGITERFKSFKDMYHLFKKSKLKYRLPLDLNNAKVSRHNSYKSMTFVIT